MPVQERCVPVREVTPPPQVPGAGGDNEQGSLQVCDTPSVPLRLMCSGTAALVTALRGSKPKFGFHGVHSNTKDSQQRVTTVHDLGGFDTPSSLVEIIIFFHLPNILEMALVVVVFESKANIRLVCLWPQAVIAGEKFQGLGRCWACHIQGNKGALRRASVETAISTACCLLIL